MELISEFFQKVRSFTNTIEPFWTIVLVPIWQEVVFRYLPYKFWFLHTNNFWLVGTASSIVFALMHWYFGGWFIIAAFFAGLLYWWVMVEYGLVAVIITHAVVNIIDLTFGIRHILATWLN